jgi:aryl-alcohol dehydrogenase-like predicted oxidoreductase
VNEEDPALGIAAVSTNDGEMVNQVGLSRKHIFDAVEKSVERLGTYIDVLQIHRLDRDTPREEIMKALNDVIEKGWVRYIGASSMAAWEFQTLQNIAEKNGWHKFVRYVAEGVAGYAGCLTKYYLACKTTTTSSTVRKKERW